MANFFRKLTKEQLAGIATAVVAAALLLTTMLILFSCGDTTPQPPPGTAGTPATNSPAPKPLIPNPYNGGDFAYRNGYITCISGKSQLGVDVSEYQGDIDWQTVAEEDIAFAMVRLGFRGYGQSGILMTDSKAADNLAGAKDAGLNIGAYFYSQAISVEEAIEEANFALQILDGRKLDMPLVFDWEIFSTEGRTYYVDKATLNACARAFCETVEAAGYEAMVYFNLDVGSRLDLQTLQNEGYGFWLALYGTMTYPHRVDLWQFTDTGYVKGIDGYVDMNLYFTYE